MNFQQKVNTAIIKDVISGKYNTFRFDVNLNKIEVLPHGVKDISGSYNGEKHCINYTVVRADDLEIRATLPDNLINEIIYDSYNAELKKLYLEKSKKEE